MNPRGNILQEINESGFEEERNNDFQMMNDASNDGF